MPAVASQTRVPITTTIRAAIRKVTWPVTSTRTEAGVSAMATSVSVRGDFRCANITQRIATRPSPVQRALATSNGKRLNGRKARSAEGG